MKTDGRQTGQGGERGQTESGGGQPESNVVRLPVDWLGPREELVPFGPAARDRHARDGRRGDREMPDRERLESNVVELTPASPSPAEGFWGEDSAAIQDALQGPNAAPGPPATDAAPGAVKPNASIAGALRARMHRPPLPRAPYGDLIVAGTIAIAGASAAFAIAALGGAPATHPRRAPLRAASLAGRTPSLRVPAVPPRAPASTPTRTAREAHPRRVVVHRARSARRRAHGAAAIAAATRSGAVRTGPVYIRSAAPSASGQSVQTPAPAAPSVRAPAARPGAGSGPGGGNPPAGPVGPGAPFGPGLLG